MARTYRRSLPRKAFDALIAPLLKAGVPVPQRTSYLMTTTGRRTGLERSAPVNLVEHDNHRWLVSPYGDVPWVHNLRANPHLYLRRGRRREHLLAEEVAADTAGPILQIYVRQVRITAPFFDARHSDPVEAFIAEARRHPVFELHPAHDGTSPA